MKLILTLAKRLKSIRSNGEWNKRGGKKQDIYFSLILHSMEDFLDSAF